MKWSQQKALRQTDKKYAANINNALTITVTISEPKAGQQNKNCALQILSGNVPIHSTQFSSYNETSAKERAVNVTRTFIENSIERYRNMLEALEKADSET